MNEKEKHQLVIYAYSAIIGLCLAMLIIGLLQ
jgi:hypothetical protein